jgi:hypothetical protein
MRRRAEPPLCAAADVELVRFRAAYYFTSDDGPDYVLLNDIEGEHIYRFGNESRLAAVQGTEVYKLFTAIHHAHSPRVMRMTWPRYNLEEVTGRLSGVDRSMAAMPIRVPWPLPLPAMASR